MTRRLSLSTDGYRGGLGESGFITIKVCEKILASITSDNVNVSQSTGKVLVKQTECRNLCYK